jgi:hypothetical protein
MFTPALTQSSYQKGVLRYCLLDPKHNKCIDKAAQGMTYSQIELLYGPSRNGEWFGFAFLL